jgi:hypothetical protein
MKIMHSFGFIKDCSGEAYGRRSGNIICIGGSLHSIKP